MFRRSNSGESFLLRRETNFEEILCNYYIKQIMNMEIATNFKAYILGLHIVDL